RHRSVRLVILVGLAIDQIAQSGLSSLSVIYYSAQLFRLINKASDEIQSVKALDVGSYKDLKAREKVGDGLEHDHIPSFAALRTAKENELGRN
ncbi:hypothetical protein, partial [Serratia nevei]|uniref:hypothetical protein n=1 Tax=Serratia nevei TaxID=2703794 RepID=UPI00254F0B1E